MKRSTDIGKSFLSGKKGGIVFIIGSLASIGVFFAVARLVDIIIKKTETEPARSVLPFAAPVSPPGQRGDSAGGSSQDAVHPKLNFYTALMQNDDQSANTTPLNRQSEQKLSPKKTASGNPATEQPATPADKSTAAQRLASPQTFVLQMGAYQKAAAAQSVVDVLRGAGYEPHTDTITVPGKGTLVRVRIGPFSDLSAAKKKAAEIEKKTKLPVGITKQ